MIVVGLLITFFLTFIITGFMLYVAMVTGIGPWVAPVIGVIVQGVSNCFPTDTIKRLGLTITVSSAVGGIIGTAFGFSFPTWFFLDKENFTQAVGNKFFFLLLIAALVMIAGTIAIVCSTYFYKDLVEKEGLPFPVGTMTYNSVTQHNQRERRYLLSGVITYAAYAFLFVKRLWGAYALPLLYTFHKGYVSSFITIPALTSDFSIFPLLLAIGFVAGSIMTVPLLWGTLLKMTCVTWLYNYYSFLPYNDYLFALCSGIVLSGTVGSLIQQGWSILKGSYSAVSNKSFSCYDLFSLYESYRSLIPVGIIFLVCTYLQGFSLLGSVYLFIATIICAYQLSFIAGKIGLALLGRFATFVMVPGMLIFGWNPLQVTLVATFVELVGGIAVDNLQGRKALQLGGVDFRHYKVYQYIALLAASSAVAFFFYYFIHHYELGSSLLCAQRAQARALLLQVATVDMGVLGCGVLLGLLLKQLSCNPVLVLSGLLMPFSLVVPLVLGGIGAISIKNHTYYEPFFSGIYVANACGSILTMFL